MPRLRGSARNQAHEPGHPEIARRATAHRSSDFRTGDYHPRERPPPKRAKAIRKRSASRLLKAWSSPRKAALPAAPSRSAALALRSHRAHLPAPFAFDQLRGNRCAKAKSVAPASITSAISKAKPPVSSAPTAKSPLQRPSQPKPNRRRYASEPATHIQKRRARSPSFLCANSARVLSLAHRHATITPMARQCCTRFEREARQQGWLRIAGLDEAGRGALFGPVVAAAVILNPKRRIVGLDDSKKLTPDRRAELAPRIREHALAWAGRRSRRRTH